MSVRNPVTTPSSWQDICPTCGTLRTYSSFSACMSPCACKKSRRRRKRERAHLRQLTTEPAGKPFRFAWAMFNTGEHGDGCFYCHGTFHNPANPPTIDHIVPRSKGGRLPDGFVLACRACNNARGDAPFTAYAEACATAREIAADARRPYRRPKWRETVDGFVIALS